VPSKQRWTFFRTWIIYNDLFKVQQQLINNKYSEQRKFMNYFMWPYERETSGHEKDSTQGHE
jgi:hypothetical protein